MACLNCVQNSRPTYRVETRVPSQHSLLIQYWPNVGLATQVVAQQWANIGSTILDQHLVFSRW